MIAGAIRDIWRTLPVVAPAAVTRGAPLVVVSPHPDDESLGVGGTVAAARAAGIDVRVVIVSDGSKSHPNSRRFPRERLVALRRAEAEAAGRHLGLASGSITHLDLPDADVPMTGLAFEAAVAHLASVVDASRAASVLVTWRHDPHCDHEAADAMARHLRAHRPALAYWSYPIWGWHLDEATEIDGAAPRGVRVDISRWMDVKARAVAAHASQMTDLIDDDPDGFRFTPDKLAPFQQPFETLLELPA